MALQKQTVRMSANGGLDTKTDEKNVLPTNFLNLVNIRFTKTGSFTKRYGYARLTNAVLESATPITSGKAVTTFLDELLRYDINDLYSYAPSEAKWVDKGVTKFALSGTEGITSDGFRLLNPSHATISNLTVHVYERSADTLSPKGIEYRVVDNITGSVLYTNFISTTVGNPHPINPSVFTIFGTFFIMYVLNNEVVYRTIQFGTPHLISGANNVISTTGNVYDASAFGGRIYVIAPNTTSVKVCFINSTGAVSSPVSVPADANVYNIVSVAAEQGTNVRLVYGSSAVNGPVKTVLYNRDLNTQLHSPLTLESSVKVTNLNSIQDPNNASSSRIYASIAVETYNLKSYTVSSAGVLTASKISFYQAALQSKLQSFEGKIYFACSKDTAHMDLDGAPFTSFRTIFFCNEDGLILNAYELDIAVFRFGSVLPNLNIEDQKLAFDAAYQAEIQSNQLSMTIQVPTSINKLTADFNTVNNYFDVTVGNNLHIAGGVLKMYDGNRVVEHGFLEIPKLAGVNQVADGVLDNGTYQYLAVYRWNDKWGQVHRSAPSLPITIVVTSAANSAPTVGVFTLSFTEKTDVEIELYRTVANGTVFYKHAFIFDDRIANDPTVERIDVLDTLANADIQKNEILYTTGGVLSNTPCLSNQFVTSFKSRVFALLSDGFTLQYSKKRQQNGPVEFAEEQQIVLDARGGKATALIAQDDNLIIFKEQALFALTGQGPNDLGQQDDYVEPALITSDCGCVDPNSIVVTPTGIMFKSSKGIYMLSRGLAATYLGSAVERYNDLTITAATLLPSTNEVRFTTSGGIQLVYDYYHNKWATDDNINAIDACVYNGIYYYLRTDGLLQHETINAFSDNGAYITMQLESAWIQLQLTAHGLAAGGVQGFERFYQMLLLGSYKSQHGLIVKFAYDFNPAWQQESNIAAGTLLSTPAYGSGYYGSDNEGNDFPLYQFRVFPQRQKCQSFKFHIADYRTTDNGEGLSLSNLAAEIGIKQGENKVPASRSFGAK